MGLGEDKAVLEEQDEEVEEDEEPGMGTEEEEPGMGTEEDEPVTEEYWIRSKLNPLAPLSKGMNDSHHEDALVSVHQLLLRPAPIPRRHVAAHAGRRQRTRRNRCCGGSVGTPRQCRSPRKRAPVLMGRRRRRAGGDGAKRERRWGCGRQRPRDQAAKTLDRRSAHG